LRAERASRDGGQDGSQIAEAVEDGGLASDDHCADVSRRLGHSKPSITTDVYGHRLADKDQHARRPSRR